jgi:hypothetical protein
LKNRAPQIEAAYVGTKWAGGAWMRALRKLSGAASTDPMKFDTSHRGKASRATKIPLDYLTPQRWVHPSEEEDRGKLRFRAR